MLCYSIYLTKDNCIKSPREVHRLIDVDHEDPILRTFILFVQTADAVVKYANAHFYKEASLSAIKFIVLRILAANGGTMRPSELAQWTLRERHNITTLVDRLEQDRLVSTERDDRDKRFVNITLTNKGHEVLTQATPVAKKIVDQVMLSITEGDVVLLEESLGVLRRNAHHGLECTPKRSQHR